MLRAALLGILVSFLFACTHTNKSNALQRKGGDRALFVGHTPDGQMVVAAHHYDAMNGLAITSDEIDATSTEDGTLLTCRREVVTGSHYPQWFCRYKEDHERQADADRQRARNFLEEGRSTTCGDCASH
ncbi:MAG TPA: hypothetical protein VFE90_09555 [Myxococcales bacterium]|jgi:phosphoglucomutase|nr:hypothetical protein [Myxococcales bacterium]